EVKTYTNPPAIPSGATFAGTMYDFGPSGTQFAQPVTVTVPYDPVKASDPSKLQLLIYSAGKWEVAQGSSVDIPTKTVSGKTT
ncbi:hypothetical protein WAJ71_21960, partial [Acinetobacter baumannii]